MKKCHLWNLFAISLIFMVFTAAPAASIDIVSGTENEKIAETSRLNTLGVSVGSAFATPAFISTFRGTFSPLRYWFAELGIDLGFGYTGDYSIDGYFSVYPFLNTGAFVPFKNKGGWYIGAGFGYMFAQYTMLDQKAATDTFAFNIVTGFNIGNFLDISYTLRTNFEGLSNKMSVGYVYRFK